MSKVDGMVEDGFETIREAFAEAQLQDEGGAQLCIYRHGKRVVDLWTGRDKVNDRPYTADTISIIMSLGFVHPEIGIAVGYVCNNMLWDYTRGPDDRWLPWSRALREAAGL